MGCEPGADMTPQQMQTWTLSALGGLLVVLAGGAPYIRQWLRRRDQALRKKYGME